MSSRTLTKNCHLAFQDLAAHQAVLGVGAGCLPETRGCCASVRDKITLLLAQKVFPVLPLGCWLRSSRRLKPLRLTGQHQAAAGHRASQAGSPEHRPGIEEQTELSLESKTALFCLTRVAKRQCCRGAESRLLGASTCGTCPQQAHLGR